MALLRLDGPGEPKPSGTIVAGTLWYRRTILKQLVRLLLASRNKTAVAEETLASYPSDRPVCDRGDDVHPSCEASEGVVGNGGQSSPVT